MSAEQLLRSLGLAVEAAPDDVPLRLHFAQLLAADGQRTEAVRQAAAVLLRDPDNAQAMQLLTQVPPASEPPLGEPTDPAAREPTDPAREPTDAAREPSDPAAREPSSPADAPPVRPDWETLQELDAELSEIAPPMFASDEPTVLSDVERTGLRLADVGGMEEVKARLEAAILAPVRNPQLVALYGKSLKGGLLLYGPPGCGKTFIARAVAGEMGASFLSVSLADVLDMYIGQSERNLHEIFATARANAPCVVFLDEIDALGQKRSQMRNSAARGTVNQLLTEMDGVTGDNDGVYVLGATNHPWDVDVALRRPGRFDRMVLVLPPDLPAREAIFKFHLIDRPIANVDLPRLARLTDGYSGADIAFICESAAGMALLDSARTNTVRMIGMADLEHAVRDVRPSIGPWLDTARNVAQFANDGGTYDDLLAYLRKRRLV